MEILAWKVPVNVFSRIAAHRLSAIEERATVWQMMHEGYDYLSNPWLYAFDGGILMDLVAALRFDRDLQEPIRTPALR